MTDTHAGETKAQRAARLLGAVAAPDPAAAERMAETERQRALAEAAEAAAAKATPVAHVDCRTFGHAWEPIEADRNPAIGWYMIVRCTRCTTERKDLVNRWGEVERRRYEYPDDYRDADHWSRSNWRMQYLRKLG